MSSELPSSTPHSTRSHKFALFVDSYIHLSHPVAEMLGGWECHASVMVLLSCELLRGELIDVLVSETLFSHKAAADPREKTEGIAVKGTEGTVQILF